MTAFQTLDAQTVAVQKLMDRLRQLAITLQFLERTAYQLGELTLNCHTDGALQAIEFLIQFQQCRFGFCGGDCLRS